MEEANQMLGAFDKQNPLFSHSSPPSSQLLKSTPICPSPPAYQALRVASHTLAHTAPSAQW